MIKPMTWGTTPEESTAESIENTAASAAPTPKTPKTPKAGPRTELAGVEDVVRRLHRVGLDLEALCPQRCLIGMDPQNAVELAWADAIEALFMYQDASDELIQEMREFSGLPAALPMRIRYGR